MKGIAMKILVLVISLLMVCSLAFAVEKKAPVMPVDATKPAAAIAEKKSEAVSAVKAAQVDINSATEEQLKAIPGIGDQYAKKIIAGRPYANKSQLKSKKIIPDAVYSKIADKIVAKQVKK